MFNIFNCSYITAANPLYIIDSNVYLELAKYFYNGKFTDTHNNDEMKDWFIKARKEGAFLYTFATLETSFDYGTNCINKKTMGQTVFAVDALITQLSDAEITAGIARDKIYNDINRDSSSFPDSIFDCNLPSLIFDGFEDMLLLYYSTYLYRLKIQMLYNDKKTIGIKKVEELFDYMLNKIGFLTGIEMLLGKMLFFGDSKNVTLSKNF